MSKLEIEYKDDECDRLFTFFCKKNESNIDYHQFVSVLFDEHLNIEKINDKINQHLEEK